LVVVAANAIVSWDFTTAAAAGTKGLQRQSRQSCQLSAGRSYTGMAPVSWEAADYYPA
jgi:hypothetical protein